MASRGEGEVFRIVKCRLFKPWFQGIQRIVVRHISCHRHLAKRDGTIGANYSKLTILEFDVFCRSLEEMCRDLARLGANLFQRIHQRHATDCRRARAVGAHTERYLAGVAVDDVDAVEIDAKRFDYQLRKRGFVTLPMAVRAG